MEDLLEQTNEIQEVIGRSYEVPDEVDEADLEAGEYGGILAVIYSITRLEELEQLALEVDEEGPTYLADVNRVPDFIDEAPVEASEV
jgi:charged multivesicular body protein 5